MKKKTIPAIMITGLMALAMCIPAFAQEPDSAGNIFEAGDSVSLPSDPFFGGVLFGQSVNADGADAAGSLLTCGQEVNISDSSFGESLYMAGNMVSLNDTDVEGNLFAAGNSITISESTSNGVYAAGNMIRFDGETNGLFVGGNQVTVSGTVNGDAIISAESVNISDDAVITGKLTVQSPSEPSLPDGAKIGDYAFELQTETEEEVAEVAVAAGVGAMIFKKLTSGLYWIIAMAAFGMLLCWLFNDHLDRAVTYIKTKTGPMIGVGIVSWMCIPLASLILCITYILAPAGGMLMLAYVLLLCAGLAFAGASLVRLLLPNMNVFLSALIGIAVLEVVRLIPVLGFLVGIAADMYLLGYVILKLWDGRLQKKADHNA